MSNIDSIIEKVQKLLALSKSDNANEAAVAAAMANKLLDQYRLSMADLETKENVEGIEEDPDTIYESGKVTRWKSRLVSILTAHYGVTYWNDCHWKTGRQFSRYRLVGRKSDITIVRYMFAWLSAECHRQATYHGTGKGRVFIACYCDGFINGVAEQLRLSRVEVKKTATDSAMIKLDARQEEAKHWLKTFHPNLRTTQNYSLHQVNHDAKSMGHSAGRSIHLGKAMDVGSKIKLLT
jgi:hypothetical protein